MARVVMEKNQYKERLFELQEAVRRAQLQRCVKLPLPGCKSVFNRNVQNGKLTDLLTFIVSGALWVLMMQQNMWLVCIFEASK